MTDEEGALAARRRAEPQPQTYGRAPMGPDGRPQVGYAQRSTVGNPLGGGGVGAGLLSAQGRRGGASILTASAGRGAWLDGQGIPTYGTEASAALGRFSMAPGGPALGGLGVEGGIGTAQAGATANRSTMSLGAQANIIEVGATLPMRFGQDDQSVRGALSFGAGLAGRLHYGDEDGDGVPEMGFGADIGFGAFDVRSETLGRAYNALSRMFGRRGPQQ